MQIEERITALERQNKRLKRLFFFIVILIGGFVVQGEISATSKIIEAEKFVLKNKQGKVRGVWENHESMTVLAMFDDSGVNRITAGLSNTDESLTFCDASGSPRIKFSFADGDSGIFVFDGNKKIRIGMALNSQGPCVDFRDSKGTRRLGMILTNEGPGFSLLHSNGRNGLGMALAKEMPSMVFTDPFGKISWAVPQQQ
ncbi:MAG: hypothetical protein HQM08_23495 [Candidatus Riflebacteria bacterium]|nr:hypothetical protein [Candidatus Riflebacteria bacterium]